MEDTRKATVVTIEAMREAARKAKSIVEALLAGIGDQPDAVAARREELMKLSKAELADMVIASEKIKNKHLTVVDVATAILTEPACQTLSYEQVAAFCAKAIDGAKTTGKSIASVASKQGGELGFLPRIRVKLEPLELGL